jgi:phosphatidylinositol alpha-1,6-mannosyltransferase
MILLISYDVTRRGGIERLTLQVKAALEQRGQAVKLLCPRALGPGVPGRWLGRLRFLLELAFWLPRASTVLSMHALLLPPLRWLDPVGRVAHAGRRQPFRQRRFCWLHGLEVWGEALLVARRDLSRCHGLIASSRFTRDRVLDHPGPWPPIRVVHPAADLTAADRTPSPLPRHPLLLTVSRMASNERYKGHRLVLAALAILRDQGRLPADLRWHVVGGGDDRWALERATATLGLDPWVRFLGELDDRDLERQLRGCSLLLLPSAYACRPGSRAEGEGFGIVYLEAAWAGRASIGCQQGGQSDLIVDGETGWLVEPDPRALAETLAVAVSHPPTLAKRGAQARQRAQAHFGWDRFTTDLWTALREPADRAS